MLELIFGLIILGVVIFLAFRILHNVVIGLLIIFLVFFASYLIIGSFPDLKNVPVIGKYIPNIPTSGEDAIALIKDVLHNIEILSVIKDSENNLLITMANTGKMEVSNFNVFVDDKNVGIINNPKDPLKSGQITVIQTNWKGNFTKILIKTDKTSVTYEVS